MPPDEITETVLVPPAELTPEQLDYIAPLTDTMTIPGLYAFRQEKRPGSIIAERRTEIGGWRPVTIEDFLAEVEVYARGLIGMGVDAGDSVALLAANSYRWMVMDLAILSIGAITVPIYESDSVKQIHHILEDANISLAITDTTQQADLIDSVRTEKLREIISPDTGGDRAIQSAARLIAPIEVTRRQENMRADDLATIIYTSGTTGVPKGVELTHRNFVATTIGIHMSLFDLAQNPTTRILLFLPLAHVLARFVMHALATGAGRVGFSPDTSNLVPDIGSFQPSVLLVVPRVLEKVFNAASAKAGGGARSKIFSWSANVAKGNGSSIEDGKKAHAGIKYALADALVLKKIKRILGPNMKYIVSGGAPLATDLARFYRGLGITLMVGYGLSETTGPITVQRPDYAPAGTVGLILPGNEVRVAEDDGEVLLKGVSVFSGYHNLPEETAEHFIDGWFKTGDIGELDQDGQLRITGRKKGIIVTAGGKNVSPEILEDLLSTHPLISHVVAVGDAKPFVGAMITLDPEMLPMWLANHGLPIVDPVAAADLPEVRDSLRKAIKRANQSVSRAESIRKFSILNATFSVENGYLTPSLKLRRNEVLKDYADDIEALYLGNGQDVTSK